MRLFAFEVVPVNYFFISNTAPRELMVGTLGPWSQKLIGVVALWTLADKNLVVLTLKFHFIAWYWVSMGLCICMLVDRSGNTFTQLSAACRWKLIYTGIILSRFRIRCILGGIFQSKTIPNFCNSHFLWILKKRAIILTFEAETKWPLFRWHFPKHFLECKMYVSQMKLHSKLFLFVQLTISRHWFR